MTQPAHQPIVAWCPNCGDSIQVDVEVYSISQHGSSNVKVQLATQYPRHTCGKTEGGSTT